MSDSRISLTPLAGTRDFFPEDMRLRRWLFEKWHETAKAFCFEEYDAPMLEPTSLYTRKSGDEISSQLFNFVDKSGTAVTLRPEMTPSLARLVMKAGSSLVFPVKWYSVPQCWRWETTTKGRKREFYQWNMDILGVPTVNCEAECLATVVHFCEAVGLESQDVEIQLSSRKLLDAFVGQLEIPDELFPQVCSCVDKYEKMSRDSVVEMIVDTIHVDEEVAYSLVEFVECETIEDVMKLVGEGNEALVSAIEEIQTLFELLKGYGIEDWVRFTPSVVRGLAYYTGVVFEAFSKTSSLKRAICGGGRYDTLVLDYGEANAIPACGYGLGDCVILEVLKEMHRIPNFDSGRVQDYVIPLNESMRENACQVVTMLRAGGRKADVALRSYRRVGKAFSYADRIGAERAILVAQDEWEAGSVKVKHLRLARDAEGREATVSLETLRSELSGRGF